MIRNSVIRRSSPAIYSWFQMFSLSPRMEMLTGGSMSGCSIWMSSRLSHWATNFISPFRVIASSLRTTISIFFETAKGSLPIWSRCWLVSLVTVNRISMTKKNCFWRMFQHFGRTKTIHFLFLINELPFARWRLMKLTQFESIFPSMDISMRSIPWSDVITKVRRICEPAHVIPRNRRSLNSSGLNGSLSTRICFRSIVIRWRFGNASRIIKKYSVVDTFGKAMSKLINCGFDFTNTLVYSYKWLSGS